MDHLTGEEIKTILEGRLQGSEMADALLHIEKCPLCADRMPALGKGELSAMIMREPFFSTEQIATSPEKTGLFGAWSRNPIWAASFAGILLLIAGGVLYYSLAVKKEGPGLANAPRGLPEKSPAPQINTTPEVAAGNLGQESMEEQPIANSNLKNQAPVFAKLPEKKAQGIAASAEAPSEFITEKEYAQNFSKVPPALKELESPAVEYRGESRESARLVAKYPVGEVVTENSPVLRWSAIKDAASYTVTIYDEDSNEVAKREVKAASLKLDTQLKRGGKYLWQVKANIPSAEAAPPLSPPAQFRVASEKALGSLKKTARGKGKLWEQANSFFKEGLLGETEKTLNEILRLNPKDKNARKLLGKIAALRKKNQIAPRATKPAQ